MVIIGSQVLNFHLCTAYLNLGRVPEDLDMVGTYEEAVEFRKMFNIKTFYPINGGKSIFMRDDGGKIIEIEIAWPDSRAEKFLQFMSQQEDCNNTGEGYLIPSLDILYMLKMSHRYLKDSPHFLKTMDDIHLMRRAGAKIRPEHQAFYEERIKDTYVYKHPKLAVSKETFFDGGMTGVYQKYDHDSIHWAVKQLDKPAYSYFKAEEDEVYCSRELFNKCDYFTRVFSVLEEAYVLALERSLIPYPNTKTPKEAFDMALMKVCTSITSGWWREFAWENYWGAQDSYDDNYVAKFNEGVYNGTVVLKEKCDV